MARINEHYLKLQSGYLFPEIARRVESFREANPEAGAGIIRCGIGDVTEPLPQAARDAMKRAVDELGSRDTFRGYGPPTGYDFIRKAIAQHDFAARGVSIDIDEVFLSDGSKIDCSAILDVLDPGTANRIGVTDPVYPVYVDSNVMVGHTGAADREGRYQGLVYLPATPANGFVPEVPGEHLDIIYLCYPNNPTGGTITRAQLESWVEYALRNDAIILYDAAYEAYITDADLPHSIYEVGDDAKRCAIEFRSFSKNGGFTGVRCGYTIVPKGLTGTTSTGERISVNRLWTRRWATKSNGVSYPVQRGAEALYSDDGKRQVRSLVDHYLTNARILRNACEALGLEVYGGVNAPYVWVACPAGVSSWEMFDRMLEEARVVITPGAGFGRMGEGFFRISAFNSRENVEQVVERLKSMTLASV